MRTPYRTPTSSIPDGENSVANLGPIKYIVALNHEHYLYVAEWKSAYPESMLIGPAGLQEKRFTTKQQPNNPSLKFDVVIQPGGDSVISEEFDSEFDSEFVWGHFNKELVFNHKPSKMLIEGDLWFNMPATEQYSKSDESAETGIVTRLGTKLHQSAGDSMVRRLMWYFFCMGKKEEFGKQVRRIASWDFEGIIPCHGAIVEEGGKQVFEEVLIRYM